MGGRLKKLKDWNYISENICYKDYDGHIHIRKLNLKTGKYSYLTLYDWELKDIKIIQEEPEMDLDDAQEIGYRKGLIRGKELKSKQLIEKIQGDLDSLNESPGIPYSYEPLNKLKEKWQRLSEK